MFDEEGHHRRAGIALAADTEYRSGDDQGFSFARHPALRRSSRGKSLRFI